MYRAFNPPPLPLYLIFVNKVGCFSRVSYAYFILGWVKLRKYPLRGVQIVLDKQNTGLHQFLFTFQGRHSQPAWCQPFWSRLCDRIFETSGTAWTLLRSSVWCTGQCS